MKLNVTTSGLQIIPENAQDTFYLTDFIGVEGRRVVKGHMAPVPGTGYVAYLCIPSRAEQEDGCFHQQEVQDANT